MRPFPSLPILATLSLIAVAPAAAQHQVTAALSVIDPKGEFDDNTDTGFGFLGTYLHALDAQGIVALGGTGTFQSYGSSDRRAPISSTIPEIVVDVETDNNTAFLQAALQITAPTGTARPYVIGTAGYGWFFTTTSIEDPFTNLQILTDTNQSDGTWIWGGGGGARFQVWQAGPPGGDFVQDRLGIQARDPARAWIDVGLRYLKGDEVEYLREGSLVTDEGEIDIDRRLARSGIELVQYQVGVTITF